MPLGAQLPVRLDSQVEASLETIAERIGTTKSSIIRLLAKTFVDAVGDEQGVVQLPPKWEQWFNRLPPADRRSVVGRSRRSRGPGPREAGSKPARGPSKDSKRPGSPARSRAAK